MALQEHIDEPEQPRSQDEQDELELFGLDEPDLKKRRSSVADSHSIGPTPEHTEEGTG